MGKLRGSRVGRWLLEHTVPHLAAGFYYLYSRTWRLEVAGAPATLERFVRGGEPVVFAHWHGDELVLVPFYAFKRLAVLASLSADGDLMARTLLRLGYQVFRGSSHRGGARGLLALIACARDGSQAALAVDGPKGPLHQVKPGIVELAYRTGLPIVVCRVRAQNVWFIPRAWNRSYVPKPFSRVRVWFSAPVPYDPEQLGGRTARAAGVAALCSEIAAELDGLGEERSSGSPSGGPHSDATSARAG